MVQAPTTNPREDSLRDLTAARSGLTRPDKFPPAVVVQLAGLAMEGLLAEWLDRVGAEAGGYTLGHRIRALARLRPVDEALVREISLLGASSAPCGAWDPRSPTLESARRALSLADHIEELTRSEP